MRILATAETGEAITAAGLMWAFVAAVALILLNALYVGYEFAVMTAKPSTFESPLIADRRSSRLALSSMSDLSMQLAGAQLGITMASLGLGFVAEPAFEAIVERLVGESLSADQTKVVGIVISLSVVGFFHLVIGEMVPKNIALARPDATLRWLVLPYQAYLVLFRPLISGLNIIANAGTRLLGVEPRDEREPVHSASELAAILSRSSEQGAIEADDAELLRGALDFALRPVGEVTTALHEVASIRLGATVAQAERVVAASGQERLPIYRFDAAARPIGYVHARDLLGVEPSRRRLPLSPDVVRSMAVVDHDRPLIEVMRTMRLVKRQLVLVLGADGAAVGIVSIEEVSRALLEPASAGATSGNTVDLSDADRDR